MIDIVQTLRKQHPDLGAYIVALRSTSEIVEALQPDRFKPEVQAWVGDNSPSARLSQRAVTVASSPGAPAEERVLRVVEFDTSAELGRFVLQWT